VFSLPKTVLLSLLGFAIVAGLGACGNQVPNDNELPFGGGATPTATSSSNVSHSSNNNTITYKSVEITILAVDQQTKFTDDGDSQSPYLLRISIKENNTSETDVNIYYNDSSRLVEADGTQIAPEKAQDSTLISQGVVRNNWIDFAVPSKLDVNTLTLRIGTNTEHQINVPLKSNRDLSQYQPITVQPNATLKYGGLNWTVTQANAQLSAYGTQATAGYRYIILTLKADNSTDADFVVRPDDYFRLQAPDVTTAPTHSTLPSLIAPGSSGTTGAITFLMPQNDQKFTLKFLARPSENIAEATADIHF
ncbi:MAG: DUF4352 domain-containing protein, partial [Chloroflexi bacterium]